MNTHCSKRKAGQLLRHPTNGGELEKYWLLWSWRHFQWPRVQHLVIPRKSLYNYVEILILSWACNTCRARKKKQKIWKQHASCSQKSSCFDISDKLGRNDIWTFGGKTGALRIISCLNPIQGWGADTMAESFLQIRRKTNLEGEKQELASIPSFPGLLDTGYPNLRFN